MLKLLHNNLFVQQVAEGHWFSLPNGDRVSPAEAGWSNEDGYILVPDIAPPVPEPTAISVQCADTSPDSMRACVASWR